MSESAKKPRKPRTRKWTPKTIKLEAAKYTTRSAFHKGACGAYLAAKELGIFEKVTDHMETVRSEWTEKKVRAEAKKFTSRTKFFNEARAAHAAAKRLGILDEVTAHMPRYAGKGKKRGPNARTLGKV